MAKNHHYTEEDIAELPLLRAGLSAEEVIAEYNELAEARKLRPLELALVCLRLVELEWKAPSIGRGIQRTPEYVNQLLSLAKAPVEIRRRVKNSQVTAAVAIEVIREYGGRASTVIEDAFKVASAKGKRKLTARDLPHRVEKKTLKAAAPQMRSILQRMSQSNEFKFFSQSMQTEVNELLGSLLPATPE